MNTVQSEIPYGNYPVSDAGARPGEAEPAKAPPVAGVSASWRKLLVQAEMAAPHLQVAAIEGEPGCGKYTLAHYIFEHSPLSAPRFLRFDAREWLATDGDATRMEGFYYLERVDLLTPPGQNVLLGLLRGLQNRRPGLAVLLVSAQTSLRQLAGQGLFVPDLAYRLTAIRFVVPPLRQRREDVGPLASALLDRLCAIYQRRPATLGPGSLARLLQHDWPGNVRELAGVLETALLESASGVIQPGDLALPRAELQPAPLPAAGSGDLSLDSVVYHHARYVLDLNRGNKLRAARQLGISRSTLYRLLGGNE